MTRNTLDSGPLPTRKNLREAEERLWNELLQIIERLPSEEYRVKADFLIWFLKDVIHGSATTKNEIADALLSRYDSNKK